jgi:hypothetical protein
MRSAPSTGMTTGFAPRPRTVIVPAERLIEIRTRFWGIRGSGTPERTVDIRVKGAKDRNTSGVKETGGGLFTSRNTAMDPSASQEA